MKFVLTDLHNQLFVRNGAAIQALQRCALAWARELANGNSYKRTGGGDNRPKANLRL